MPSSRGNKQPVPPWRAFVFEQFEPTRKSLDWFARARRRADDRLLTLANPVLAL
jgi:hypothetical protein